MGFFIVHCPHVTNQNNEDTHSNGDTHSNF